MKLLELPSGMISLEYAMDEHAEVRARLAEIAHVSVIDHTTYSEVTVGDAALIHMSDWDEPCLIAQSSAGNEILRRVCGSGITDISIAAE